ncbi:MAG TPA: alanine--glyoxylate aminotransferase family protein [Candidatus Paceibacterota bacterium]|nr:alanine--glyoxylate aminotransferase family protein [Verrucomicrobiota bacterium]HRY50260.1 alanine--glyoxylate aminotransferase family protein [Candidatus Paceibacterota bacterium]HSA03520.1 alanine--glyoxylate aminotransferase family protein [Candidatus Paceibacterota bacterium]
MGHVKLFIPGPVEVSEKILQAFRSPVIGHRGQGFKDLYARIQPQLQQLFYTRQPVFLSTSSAWGVMEGAIRNLVSKKVLCCMNGAFSDKWLDVAQRCGKEAEGLKAAWGSPIRAEAIDARLATGQFDTLTLIHNETSTGVMSPIEEIAALKKKYPDIMFIVDAVSSFSGVKLPFDDLGLDVLLTGSQKALALPPGLALFTCSPAAFARASTVSGRGYYFDFLEFKKNAEGNMTPSTPTLGHIFALESKLEDICTEGLDNRYARHRRLAQVTRDWAARHGFTLFPDDGHVSMTLTCVNNGAKPGGRIVDAEKLVSLVKKRGFLINGGYGKIKGTTFRISNMGDETETSMGELFAALDEAMKEL